MLEIIPLSDLKLNEVARVLDINYSEIEKQRYLDLGIVKGTTISPIFKSPFGNPIAYEIRKSVIALRKENSENILVAKI